MQAVADHLCPPTIPGYTLLAPLGIGGFAVVWAGCDRGGEPVAIKIANNPTELARRRFEREASAMAALAGRDVVPSLLESDALPDGRPYVVMERLFGRALDAELRAGAPTPARARELVAAVAAALDRVHRNRLVHADLKPANIVVLAAPRLELRLLDLGLARPIDAPATLDSIAGTAAYMSPEQLRGEPLRAASDVYALGVILYEMLAGRPPFAGDRAAVERGHVALRPPRPGDHRAVPGPLETLCLAALAKDPARRPALDDLRERLDAIELDAASESEPGPGRAGPGRTTLAAAREPVVLLLIDGAPDAATAICAAGGVIARRRGDRLIAGFTGALADPAGAALQAARAATAALGARAALHIASLRVRGDPPSLYGRELERPETWLPGGGAAIAATAEFEQISPARQGRERSVELVGRDAELAAAERSWRAVVRTRTPGLFTALAGPGLGKTRFAEELARLRRDGAPVIRGGRDPAAALRAARDRAAAGEAIALVIDDLHAANDALLDAIERATLDAPATPLWIAACADPALAARRRQWGLRAARADVVELRPLDRDAARAAAAAFLRPAEYPPVESLDRLVSWTGGNPQLLRELARTLERVGAIRRRGSGFYLATAALDALPAEPVGQWLANRQLDCLPDELAACARVCAVLGGSFHRDELAHVLEGAARFGAAATDIDADVGLTELAARGLIRGGPVWSFAHPGLAAGLYDLIDERDRVELHRLALEYWSGRDDRSEVLEARARHAAACGDQRLAAASWAALAGRARAGHRYEAADLHYTAALACDPDGAASLLIGRGAMRVKSYRLDEAIADLTAAYDAASTEPDRASAALELATALDFAERLDESATWTGRARRHAAPDDPRLALAEARVLYREQRWSDAVAGLEGAVASAAASGDADTRAAALLILATALVIVERLDDARARFDEVIALCDDGGDRAHLAIAYSQRPWLWSAVGEPERGVDDLRRAVALARRIGQPHVERVATHNLAEMLLWAGELDEARRLARRGFALQTRFASVMVADDALLLARIEIAMGHRDRAMRSLEWIATHASSINPANALLIEMVELAANGGDEASWADLERRARPVLPDEERAELAALRFLLLTKNK